jgi:hypothetical protein
VWRRTEQLRDAAAAERVQTYHTQHSHDASSMAQTQHDKVSSLHHMWGKFVADYEQLSAALAATRKLMPIKGIIGKEEAIVVALNACTPMLDSLSDVSQHAETVRPITLLSYQLRSKC